jgi:hypothetical protein
VDVPGWHWPFASQQPPQLKELHAGFWHVPPLQKSPGGHCVHAPPNAPHSRLVVPPRQFPLASQQPPQFDALHAGFWHAPP